MKLSNINIDPAVIRMVSAKFSGHYKIIPVDFKDNLLTVATAHPADICVLDDLRLLLGVEIKEVLAGETDILEASRKYYGIGAETIEKIISAKPGLAKIENTDDQAENLQAQTEDVSIINFVNQLFLEAINNRSSDIHFEPLEDGLRVRFRIDGLLYEMNIPPSIKYLHSAIISRIKIMAKLNIAQRRLPQDGRFKVKINNEELDLRVSVIPLAFGEGAHIRILGSRSFLELEKIGLLDEDLKVMEQVIKKPHGIIFVTGPTGSGKSTTLYASLARINSGKIKIITIEDPVEYQLKGVNQIQVAPQIGFDFASALRHVLRHDPDILMVGEVRDYETAEIAIRSALTGHLIFSTLHTNDAAGALARLLDMGVEPFLLSSSIECLIAQRLVRVICPKCKVGVKNMSKIFPGSAEIYEGKGCPECRFTGYFGRTGIYEILLMTEPIRELILARASSRQIKQKAILQGMRTLRQDGLAKVLAGKTTLAEVMRVTQPEEPL